MEAQHPLNHFTWSKDPQAKCTVVPGLDFLGPVPVPCPPDLDVVVGNFGDVP